jgi:2-amino-4-hydroxy-6-hydroxymethyldihydropteridine diphosphokinase
MVSFARKWNVSVSVKRRLCDCPAVRAYVALGANLGDREATIRKAVELLAEHADVDVVALSTLRETEPWGPVEQPPYLNGVAAVETELAPRKLLDLLLDVERRLGRVRGERWGPRTIDLDLLLYGRATVDQPGLTVPHPRLHERRFALEPLVELDPQVVVPERGRAAELLNALDADRGG